MIPEERAPADARRHAREGPDSRSRGPQPVPPREAPQGHHSPMTKRSHKRRTDDEIVADLEAKIAQLKQKQEQKERPTRPF